MTVIGTEKKHVRQVFSGPAKNPVFLDGGFFQSIQPFFLF